MSTEANKTIVRRFLEAFNAGDLDGVAELCAPNVVVHNSGAPDPLSLAGFTQLAGAFLAAFPGGEHTIEDMIGEGDRVVTRVVYYGTHTGDLMGMPPTGKQVYLGLSTQLTLEAGILRQGGFKTIPAASSVSELVYVKLSGNNPPGEERLLELRIKSSDPSQFPDDAADQALQKLAALIRRFDNDDQPYRSLALSMWSNRYGRYDDLARIKEWSATGGTGRGDA